MEFFSFSLCNPNELVLVRIARHRIKIFFIEKCVKLCAFQGWIGKNDTKALKEKGKKLLEQLGLGDRIHHKPQELSGGEQQRVAVARALINDPKVIFADEPSGNLDSQNANSLHELFFKLRDEIRCTIVIVTHNESLASMADRKILLKDGKIVL